MGRGNCCVTGPYEGLYFIDNDHIHVYRRTDDFSDEPEICLMGDLDYCDMTSGEWLYDEEGTMNEWEDIEECFKQDFCQMFPSFKDMGGLPDKWVRNGPWGDLSRRVLLENKLFYICIEDNEWSMAVELIQKEPMWGFEDYSGLQKRHYQKYLDGIKTCLLVQLPSIGTYAGAWTSGVIHREELKS